MKSSTQISPVTLVCQSPSEPFQSQLSKDWQRVQGKFIIYSGHIINSTKTKEFNSKTKKRAQCREQGTRGPQSLLHTYRAMGPHLPRWQQPSLLTTPVPRHPPSTPNLLLLPHQALTSRALGPALHPLPRQANSCSAS